jgi:chemotaxis signal transduction protein
MPHDTIRMLKCRAGERDYCLDVGHVLAIERGARLTPNSAETGPDGWIQQRNRRIPVYSLARKLGEVPGPNDLSTVLVIKHSRPWGLAVERVSRFQNPPSAAKTLPPAMNQPQAAFFRGVIVDDGALILFLSPEALGPDAAPPEVRQSPPAGPAHVLPQTPGRTGPGRMLLFSPPNRVPGDLLPSGGKELLFGISYSQVLEIVFGSECAPMPSAPRHIAGMTAWRKLPVTVVDAGVLFGFEPAPMPARSRLLIARSTEWRTPVAIPVGDVVQTVALPLPHRRCSLPFDCTNARGVFEIARGQVMLVPDIDAMAGPIG